MSGSSNISKPVPNVPRMGNAKNTRISTGDKNTRAQINNLKLAEVIDLIERSQIKLQESLDMLTKTTFECRLEVNIDKTKVMFLGLKSLKSFWEVCCQLVDVKKKLNKEQHSPTVLLLILKRYEEAMISVSPPNFSFFMVVYLVYFYMHLRHAHCKKQRQEHLRHLKCEVTDVSQE